MTAQTRHCLKCTCADCLNPNGGQPSVSRVEPESARERKRRENAACYLKRKLRGAEGVRA